MKKERNTIEKICRIVLVICLFLVLLLISNTSAEAHGSSSKFYLGLRNTPCPYRIIQSEKSYLIKDQKVDCFSYINDGSFGLYLKTNTDTLDFKGDYTLYTRTERINDYICSSLVIESNSELFNITITEEGKILLEKI